MTFSLFLNSLLELFLNFCSETLDYNPNLIYIPVLWLLLLLLFCFLVRIPSPTTFRENEHTEKCQYRAKRRRKGGTPRGHRYSQREEEDITELTSVLKSPLGQGHTTTKFRQMLCRDPSCDMCNNVTAGMDRLLHSLALEDATPSVSPLASTAPVTEPTITQSPAFSVVPPGDIIPSPPPECFPPPTSTASPKPVSPSPPTSTAFPNPVSPSPPTSTACPNPVSPSPSDHTLSPDPTPLEPKSPVDHSPTQHLAFPSLLPEMPLLFKTIYLDCSITENNNNLPDLAKTVNSYHEEKQKRLPQSEGKDHCLNTSQGLSFFDFGTQQKLEAHTGNKVLLSAEDFKLRGTSSHSLFDSNCSSTNNLISQEDSKSGSFPPLSGTSKTHHEEKVKSEKSAAELSNSLPSMSPVGKEELYTLRCSPSDVRHGLAEEAQRICPPKLPARQPGAGHETKEQSVKSSGRAETGQGKMKKLEHASMPNNSRETSRAEKIVGLQSKKSAVLTTNKLRISQEIGVTSESPSSDLKNKFMEELNSKLSIRNTSQAQGQHTNTARDSDNLAYKASPTQAQGDSRVDTGASQVLHGHLGATGVSMEQQQEPRTPRQTLCQAKTVPPAAEKMIPTIFKSENPGRGEAGLGTPQPGSKRFPEQNMELGETLGSKSAKNLSVKRLIQWLQPGIKSKKQEFTQEKSNLVPAQSRGPSKGRATITGSNNTQKIKTDIGNFLKEKLGHRHSTDTTCPQATLPSAVKFGRAPGKAAVPAPAEPVQGHTFNCRAPSCKVTDSKSCLQAADFTGRKPTSSRHIRYEGRHPQKVVALNGQVSCEIPQPVPRPIPTCRLQGAQGPPAAPTSTEGDVSRVHLFYLDTNRFCRISRGNVFPPPNNSFLLEY